MCSCIQTCRQTISVVIVNMQSKLSTGVVRVPECAACVMDSATFFLTAPSVRKRRGSEGRRGRERGREAGRVGASTRGKRGRSDGVKGRGAEGLGPASTATCKRASWYYEHRQTFFPTQKGFSPFALSSPAEVFHQRRSFLGMSTPAEEEPPVA